MRRLLVLLPLLFIFISCTSVPNMGYLQPNGDYYESKTSHFTQCIRLNPEKEFDIKQEFLDKYFEDDPVGIYGIYSNGNAFMSGGKVKYHGVLAADIVAYNKGYKYLAITNLYPQAETTTQNYTSYGVGGIYSNTGKYLGSYTVPYQSTYNVTKWWYQTVCFMYSKTETLEKIKKLFGEVTDYYMDYDPKKKW